jgi:hypothetical protein
MRVLWNKHRTIMITIKYGSLCYRNKSRANLFVHTNNNLTQYKENSLVLLLSITTAAGSHVINTAANSVQLNKWHHIAFSVSADNVYMLYIDGVIAPYTSTGTAAAASTNAVFPAYWWKCIFNPWIKW